MDPDLECCVLGCHAKPNQGLRFYRFPCHNPQISSIWEQRICNSATMDLDILNDHVCELHFDYRCKTGNDCALEEGSLPTLHLPNFGTLVYTGNAHFQTNANRIEEPSYKISMDALSYHCRFCLRRGLLYEVEASTYRNKSFLSLIDLPQNVLPYNTQPNACLSCLKSIVIAHQLSMAVEHSNVILQLLLQHPKQSKMVSNTNFFDVKSELAFCNLILANSLSIKLEFESEDNMVCANENYEQKWVATGESTSLAAYVNTKNMFEKSICIAENQDYFCLKSDSVTSDKHYQKEFHKPFAIGGDYTTALSAEGIPNTSENSDPCVQIENTYDNAEVMAANTDDSCQEDRQFDNGQTAELASKAVNEPTYKYDLCKFSTNYKANLEIHKSQPLSGNDKAHFYCQKCEKYFLLRRHFVRHNTIVHADDFICKISDKPHPSATKLTGHYTEHQHFQCDIPSEELRSGHRAHMLDHKKGQTTSTTIDKNAHWNENVGVYVCPLCDWRNLSFHMFNVHMGNHQVHSGKNSTIGSQELETLKTDPVRHSDGKYQCTECPRTFKYKSDFSRHKRIHTDERPYKCTECPKTFSNISNFNQHKRIHTNEKPYKCTECPKTFNQNANLRRHKRIHTNERPYKCTECAKTFSQKSILSTHKKIHSNDRPYKCTECTKTFITKNHFHIHWRIHTNERPFKCTECTKTFSQNRILSAHMKLHSNERPYKCTECSKAFITKNQFNIHRRIHTNERPYNCTECSKAFLTKNHLDMHRRIHKNERLFKCTECPKTFNNFSNLSQHKRIHTNERPYKCTECPKTFKQNFKLKQHKRIHTNE